jgi:hypothetical protein
VIDTNAFQCVNHEVAGVTVPGVSRSSQPFGIRVLYENQTTLKNIGNATTKTSTIAGYTADAAALVGNTEGKGYSISLNCHDANGEDNTVTFTQKTVTISSYEDNAIVARLNTWANVYIRV